uniref:Di-domain hemoglobin n=1 Tax=Daphnia magna TaxID=35525 RepID=A0A0P4Y328_9CRUS
MTWLILGFCALLSLAAGESPYGDRYSGGISPGYGGTGGMGGIGGTTGGYGGTSGGMGSPYHGTTGGPFVTTTTVTTVLDLSTGITKTFHSSGNRAGADKFSYGGESRMMEGGGGGFFNILSENDITTMNNSWSILRKRSDFAPKVFVRYFKAKPEAQKLFPEFASIPLTDLPNNHDFLNAAYSCVASLDYILPHLKIPHPERCPVLMELKNKYSNVDLKKFGPIWMTAMQEEMGNALTNEVRDVWKKAFVAFTDYASQ